MAIKYKKISPCIWNDSKVHSMTNDGKLALLYMLTHPMQTSLGAIRTTTQGLGNEVKGLGREAFIESFASGIALESSEAPLIWFPNFTKYNSPESPNVANSWGKSLLDLPHCVLKKRIYSTTFELLKEMGEGYVEGFHLGLGKGFREGNGKATCKGSCLDFIEEYALSVAVTEANYIYQYSSSYTCAREGKDWLELEDGSFINTSTGEVYREE